MIRETPSYFSTMIYLQHINFLLANEVSKAINLNVIKSTYHFE